MTCKPCAARRLALPFLLYFAALVAVIMTIAGCVQPVRAPVATGTVSAATVGAVTPADRTLLDEKALAGVELAYRTARIAMETATDAGLITGGRAADVAILDQRAWSAVQAARAAYAAGNATSYREAIDRALVAVDAIAAATGRH